MIKYLLGSSIVLYIASVIFPSVNLALPISIISLAIVVFTFFIVPRFVKVIGGLFLAIGLFLLITNDAGWKDYLHSFGPMLNLLTLFAMIPILAIPIKLGDYANGIQDLIRRRVHTSGQLYMMTSGLSYFFSIFMNLATLPMTYYSIRPAATLFSLQDRERFMSRAITHGFAMPLMWAPVTPIVGIVIEMTGVKWASMLPYLLPLSVAGLLLDWYLGKRVSKKYLANQSEQKAMDETAATSEEVVRPQKQRRLFHILLAILIFNLAISLFDFFFSFSFIILVALLVIPFALAWSLLIGKGRSFGKGLEEHFQTHLLKMREQFFIFLTAGFFISTITFSQTDHLLNEWILGLTQLIGIHVFIVLLPLLPLALAFTGLHPAVGLVLLAEALDPQSLGISSHILTVSMLAGAVSAFLMGPYNATIGLMSSIVNTSSFKVSNWNGAFTFFFLTISMVYLVLLQLLT